MKGRNALLVEIYDRSAADLLLFDSANKKKKRMRDSAAVMRCADSV